MIVYWKKGQLAIMIIVAVVIVLGIVVYFVYGDRLGIQGIQTEFVSVYKFYDSCIQDAAQSGIDLAESQGGRIYIPEYEPGSEYAPFSSQLNFLGFPIPYWYYVSGNGLIKEQAPGKSDMEEEMSLYIRDRIRDCDFEPFYAQGFSIENGELEVDVEILKNSISASVNSEMVVSRENSSARKAEHKVEIASKLGKLYETAQQIYENQKNKAFLEDYAVDVLRLYAPVDGVEIQCSPKIWKTRDVVNDIKNGLENNIGTIKFDGNYYELNNQEREYFVVKQRIDENVNLIYSKDWPTKIEIAGADDELMIANTIGNQEGLGILGFCYAPYHFVYDLSFPVLIQVYEGDEIFQFPVAVIIDKNLPRRAIFSEFNETEEIGLCNSKTQNLEVNVYDTSLNKINANISYECFNERCRLGETENGVFRGKAPACVNGYINVQAEGYSEKKELLSTNEQSRADIVLDREYESEIEVEIAGKLLQGNAIVSFSGEKIKSAVLPEVRNIKLSEGFYNVSVYVYGNSSLKIPGSTKRQCTEVSESGIAGLFGGTREECVDITISETAIENALIGGGKTEIYLIEDELAKGKMKIKVNALPNPTSIEQLQNNFAAFEESGIDIEFG